MIKSLLLIFAALFVFATNARAQVDDICREFGVMPSMDSPFIHVPYVYGRITVKGLDPGSKFPSITVFLLDSGNAGRRRLSVERSGNYCFRRSGGGETLVVEVNGIESARRSLTIGAAQQREDFEVLAEPLQQIAPTGIVSAKFSYPPNEKTVELYKKALEAESNKDVKGAIIFLKKIVAEDPLDFIAWAKLGTLYFGQASLADADAAFRKSLELRQDYTPAWINVGQLRVAQKQFEAAIEIFKHAASLEPTSARIQRLLGETYLQTKQGTLGADALNEAIRLDPVGMAECHLLLGRLYDLAGARNMATREYKAFLAKVPEYSEKKKLEKYIKENPE
jgi:tetratricopeptide (TPR) repeat protein